MPTDTHEMSAFELLSATLTWLNGTRSGPLVRPRPRIPFVWPPHSISSDFHVQANEWQPGGTLEIEGQLFPFQIARTPHGLFGRVEKLWNEAKTETEDKLPAKLKQSAEPFFYRQREIARLIGSKERYEGRISDLSPANLIRLLYSEDRDISHDACVEIETHASLALFAPTLIAILADDKHPYRRHAQWCVLDLFEDLPSYCPTPEAQAPAIEAIRQLIYNSTDDWGRTIYKAGVVLGGHICTEESAGAVLNCLQAPSKHGRRSAIHASFHLAEWMPEQQELIVHALESVSKSDPEELLRNYAQAMLRDVISGESDHVSDVVFPEEL